MQPATPDGAPGRFAYVVIRVPKSGSTSLANMLRDALAGATVHEMPTDADVMRGRPLIERLRQARKLRRALRRGYGTTSMEAAWRHLAGRMQAGDVVTGHIRYGDPQLPDMRLRYITLVRDPVARALSHYNYSRIGFNRRHFIQKLYHFGPDSVAGRRDFSSYLAYLDEHRALYGNIAARYVLGRAPVDDPAGFLRGRYFHVGSVENMPQFLRRLGDKLGVPVAMRRDNITPRREATQLSTADRPVFERVFARDIEIYEAVRRLEAEAA